MRSTGAIFDGCRFDEQAKERIKSNGKSLMVIFMLNLNMLKLRPINVTSKQAKQKFFLMKKTVFEK